MYGRGLYEAVKPFCEKIRSIAEDGRNTCILTHLDADGLISASIISLTLLRLGAKCVIRAISDITPAVIEQMKSEAHDFYIISDLGSGLGGALNDALGDRWIIIDHHQLPNEETLEGQEPHRRYRRRPARPNRDGAGPEDQLDRPPTARRRSWRT